MLVELIFSLDDDKPTLEDDSFITNSVKASLFRVMLDKIEYNLEYDIICIFRSGGLFLGSLLH